MCMVMILVGLKFQLLSTSILLIYIPSVQSRCGCHGVPGPGFFAQGRPPAVNHNFEPLPQAIQPGSENKDGQYSIPNFRVLLFTPTFLDYHEQPVGMPYVQSIVLSNPSDQNDIEIRMINALPPFHASKFSKKVLAPLTNMTLDLIFLATMVGNVEHTIYIHTTQGNFPYQVFGVGLPNPYRLRAFVSARIPINGTFSPYINMYNPFSEAIQITEMYSSGNDLHLDLLTNENENSSLSKLWEIQPYETKAIMKATYYSKEYGIAVRFIRIVIGPPAPSSHVVILPFEMLVSTKAGLYTNIDILDFGTLRTMDEPKALNLNVMNYGNKSLRLLSIQVIPPNKAINVQFTPVNLKPSKKHTKIATITYTAVHASQRRQNSGKIIVHSSDEKKKLEVPYQANVLHGTLAYSVGKTSFYVGHAPKTQVLTITNTFNVTLVIYNATLPPEAKHVFSIVNFSKAIMVPPGKLVSPLSLYFHANKSQLSFSTVLRLYTNASIFTIPVQCYNGKLKYKVGSGNEGKLDYGTIGTQENRTLTFDIINNNPVEVSIKEYGTHVEFARLRLLHIKNKKKSKFTKRTTKVNNSNNNKVNDTSRIKDSAGKNRTRNKQEELVLKPSDVATFAVEITGPKTQGTYRSEVKMKTVYETIKIPILLKTVEGTLVAKPKRIKIEKAFPGRTENYPLSVESSFGHTVALQNLSIYPDDPRFQFIRPDVMPKLHPKEKTHIGWVKFDPFYGNEMQCYVCICELDPACDQWYHSLVLSPETWELDFNLLDKLRRKWDDIESKQESSFNASIVLDSSVIKSYTIPVQASLAWPNLVEQSIKFPATHVGNVSIEEMIITNPSDHPLVVQVVPLLNYPQPDGGLDLLSDRLIMDSFSLDLNGHSLFYLPEIKDGLQEYKKYFNDLNVVPSSKSLILLLEPRQKKSVQVGFMPEDEIPKTSIMVVRNNLTILDLVVVHGQGARTYFNINGKLPGGDSSLLFEIKAVHLKDCHKSTPKARVYPSFTVKRSFTATNVGQLPVHVVSMHINSYECEGYGFRILNCESFVLMPNASRKVDITFIPDFSTSRVSRKLSLITTMGQSLDFTLLATLPHHLLPLCANALPRPFWEPYLHIVAAVIMSSVFILIIFFAYFDAQKYVVQCTITAGASTGPSLSKDLGVYAAGTVFDLNAIAGVKVRITDKKEKYIAESKPNQKATKTVSSPNVSKSFISSIISTKPCETVTSSSSSQRELGRSLSDCTSYVTYSNNMNGVTSPTDIVLDEKPDLKPKESNGSLPKRSKKKTNEVNRSNIKRELEEPREPVIVTEEIRDPWERGLMEKVRLERQRQKNRVENQEEGDKQKTRKKTKTNNKKDTANHRCLQKENSNGSSNTDDQEQTDAKTSSTGFTTIEKSKQKKKIELSNIATYPSTNNTTTTLDKLDEIPLSGPRPDGKEAPRKSSKNENSRGKNVHKKSSHLQEKEKVLMDIPTSPHAIAAAIVEAALVKSQQKKKSKGKHDKVSGSAPTSPTGLSASSRSSSYSSIVCEVAKMGERARSTSPSEPSPSNSNKGSPKHSSKEGGFFKDTSGKKNKKTENSGGWGSYLKRLGIGFGQVEAAKPVDEPTSTGNSMFYYDNLTSLRASKQSTRETEPIDTKAPGSGVKKEPQPPVVSGSTLSPDSAEFVPLSQRLNKVVGSNPKKDNSWATVDDSALEHLRPPPGLSRNSQNIWGLDSLVSGPQLKDKDTNWDSPIKKPLFEGSYSSLLGQGKDGFSSFDILGSSTNSDELWKSEDSEFPAALDKDLWGNPTTTIRSSIWDAPDALMSPAGTPGSSAKRSRLGLGLDLKPEVGLSDGDSPLDPFSIWVPGVDPAAPYEGWNQDIKEE